MWLAGMPSSAAASRLSPTKAILASDPAALSSSAKLPTSAKSTSFS
jgi:hypothetical protein